MAIFCAPNVEIGRGYTKAPQVFGVPALLELRLRMDTTPM